MQRSEAASLDCSGITAVSIDAIVAPVDCFYVIPLAHTAGVIVALFLLLVEQCCGGSSTQTAYNGHHHCNPLAPPHILFFLFE